MSTGWFMNNLRYNAYFGLFIQNRNYAARKGTRQKARKNKIKTVIEKVQFIPHAERINKTKIIKFKIDPFKEIDDSGRPKVVDDVWYVKCHQEPVLSLQAAVEAHCETHHPTLYNDLNAFINARIELNLQREKKTRTMGMVTNLVHLPHIFELNENRRILAFCKNKDDQKIATEAGATFVGGMELIKKIQEGKFLYKDYDYIVSHVDILPDLLLIRGLLKRKLPNTKQGSLGDNMDTLVKRFKEGIEYTLEPDETFKKYGVIDVAFGKLNMDVKKLKENFSILINNIYSMKPRISEPFILRVQITSFPSPERFKIDFNQFLSEKVKEIEEGKEEEEEDDRTAVIALQ
ncbi:mitochondrial ribosomal protein L1 isoform X2 [Ptiloglossa arizonensis]|uniref:mitochondrial ribosomal protein L1 isoform X2 n=1 Tax=Ptiloglossa arizonensis TaxID=3350558 RepID=UPI003FA14810